MTMSFEPDRLSKSDEGANRAGKLAGTEKTSCFQQVSAAKRLEALLPKLIITFKCCGIESL